MAHKKTSDNTHLLEQERDSTARPTPRETYVQKQTIYINKYSIKVRYKKTK